MLDPAARQSFNDAITENDPHTHGINVLGLDEPEADLDANFKVAAGFDLMRGFAVAQQILG